MNKDTALSALLDFYSDKASAHASFLVAIVIGLFAILTLEREVNELVVSVLFSVLWSAGLWSLWNFGYWSEHASYAVYHLVNPKSEISTAESLNVQIHQQVEKSWNHTLWRYFFLMLKKTRLHPCELSLGKREERLRLAHFFTHFYFAFGFTIYLFFLPKESIMYTVWLILFVIFVLDVISLIWKCVYTHNVFIKGAKAKEGEGANAKAKEERRGRE